MGIGKRRFGKDWGRRVWLFEKLVWATVSYGVEVWGWKCRERVEGLQERYLKWVLGVERCTPGYMVREEMQREMLRGKAGMRAWGMKGSWRSGVGGNWQGGAGRRLREGRGGGKCWEGGKKERKEYYEERGWIIEGIERARGGGS